MGQPLRIRRKRARRKAYIERRKAVANKGSKK
jgi:hypothetical protein